MSTENSTATPAGLCGCGCGGQTSVATRTNRGPGIAPGQHRRFIKGHGSCRRPPEVALDPKASQAARARAWLLKERFGMTVAEYDEMLAQQGGVCAICRQPETATHRGIVRRLGVDHCHSTGKVRGLLCNDCNSGIARLHDNPEWCDSAAAYLRRHG